MANLSTWPNRASHRLDEGVTSFPAHSRLPLPRSYASERHHLSSRFSEADQGDETDREAPDSDKGCRRPFSPREVGHASLRRTVRVVGAVDDVDDLPVQLHCVITHTFKSVCDKHKIDDR